jgi:uncharacterized flavoprotein (TIGR03862 family)
MPTVAVIGAGPAGLMASEVLSAAGLNVHVYDAMPSVGRKFLLAGLGGLNLTHAEPFEQFVTRYGERTAPCTLWLRSFGPQAVRDWAQDLGIDTFVGTSQRVFPSDMKAAPLLRAWLHRLRHPTQGTPVTFHMRHRWSGQLARNTSERSPSATPQALTFTLVFETPHGPHTTQADVVLLALGGGSWARLGSDGAWQSWLAQQRIDVAPLRPSNCGFDVQVNNRLGWSDHFASRFAGEAFKSVQLSFTDSLGRTFKRKGEFVATTTGIEGSLVYAASALLRDEIERTGQATVHLSLRPEWTAERVLSEVSHPRGAKSLSSHLKSRLNLNNLHLGLLHEVLSKEAMHDPVQLAHTLHHLPITLYAPRPLDEAISSAGGVRLEALTAELMVRAQPGLFIAGEMLDWEAPTGGYLLTACLASGRVAAGGVLAHVHADPRQSPL